MLVGIVALAGTEATGRETGALDTETLEFRDPFSDGVFSIGLLSDEHGTGEAHGEDEHGGLSVRRFATVVYTLGPIGWLLEALVTAAVLGYVARVRPSLILGANATPGDRPRFGDEQGRH